MNHFLEILDMKTPSDIDGVFYRMYIFERSLLVVFLGLNHFLDTMFFIDPHLRHREAL